MPDLDAADDFISDDVLRLMFVSSHPVLTTESRVALTLRLVGGLDPREIARAFLAAEAHGGAATTGPSGPSPRRACRSRCPARTSGRSGWRPCWRSST